MTGKKRGQNDILMTGERMPIVKTEGIVLKGRNWRESSRIVSVFTRHYGKVSVVAKGARRPKSKFGASLEPMTHINLIFYKRERKNIYTLSETYILQAFERIRTDLEKLKIGGKAVVMLERLLPNEDVNFKAYSLALNFFSKLDSLENYFHLRILSVYFIIHILKVLGWDPGNLRECVRCGKEIEPQAKACDYPMIQLRFSHSRGGVLCFSCSNKNENSHSINFGTIQAIRNLKNMEMNSISEFKEDGGMKLEDIESLLFKFLDYHSEGVLRKTSREWRE